MHDPTDETLMAYADGLLDEAQSRVLDARLASDPDLRRRLEPFVVTGKPLARLFNDTLTAELPARLLDTIYERAPSERRTLRVSTANRSSATFWPAWFGLGPAGALRLAGAIGACVALGIAAGWMARGEFASPVGGSGALMLVTARGILARGDLVLALDGATSASQVQGRDEQGAAVTLRPTMTFFSDGGAVCRQYRVDRGADEAFGGLACRTEAGDWRIEVHTPTAPLARPDGTVRPASAETPPLALDGAIDRLIRSDPLTIDDEKELMRTNWTRNSGR